MSSKIPKKEGLKKLNETIKQLRSEISQKDKRIRTLENELVNLTKPIRPRKAQEPKQTHEEWRRDFIKRLKNKE